MRYPKIRELIEAIKALFKGPYTSQYPYKPLKPAKRFRGKPQPNNDGCIACKACAEICPARAIEVKDKIQGDRADRTMIWHLDECHFCGQCETYCTTKNNNPAGVKLTGEFELAGFSRSDMVAKTDAKALALCELCGEVITSKLHLDWISKQLGPLAFSNPTLFVSSLKGLGLVDEVESASKKDMTRADRIRILCARCRRQTVQEK